jgi:regulator of replication initiation timing
MDNRVEAELRAEIERLTSALKNRLGNEWMVRSQRQENERLRAENERLRRRLQTVKEWQEYRRIVAPIFVMEALEDKP